MAATAVPRQWQHEVQISIMRRHAAMARAVLPRPSDHAMWLLTGHIDAQPSSGGRELRIEDADDGGSDASVEEGDDASLHEGAELA